jgi:RNA polymerase sigma factor (sigma-70 family)
MKLEPVTVQLLSRARAGDELAFRELTDPFLRELQLHCYRILGSLQDAEDMLQETLLAAWRGLDEFERRASLRTWLYRIATNRCLNLLPSKARRPAKEVPPMIEPPTPTRSAEPIWLQPYPDVLLEGLPDSAPRPGGALRDEGGDGARVRRRPATDAALQRTALVLRDVLGFSARESASAFGCYLDDRYAPVARPFSFLVLTLVGEQISAITAFTADTSIFARFGLPRTLPRA